MLPGATKWPGVKGSFMKMITSLFSRIRYRKFFAPLAIVALLGGGGVLLSACTSLGAPTGLSAVPHNGSVTLSWVPPLSQGTGITGYLICWSTTPTPTCSAHSLTTTKVTVTVSTLVVGKTYAFEVRAETTNFRTGAWSKIITATHGAPDAPTNPTIRPGGDTVTVSWAAPATVGLAHVKGYQVCWAKQTTLTRVCESATQKAPSLLATSFLIRGLIPVQIYYVEVAAINHYGTGAFTTPKLMIPGSPPPPTIQSIVKQVSGGHVSVTVTWSEPSSSRASVTGYEIYFQPSSLPLTAIYLNHITVGPLHSATLAGLKIGQSYVLEIAARNAIGFGPASSPQSFRT